MASGGKHLNPKSGRRPAQKHGGSHLSEKSRAQAEKRKLPKLSRTSKSPENSKVRQTKVKVGKKRRTRRSTRKGRAAAIVMSIFCLLTVSPLRGCIISDGDYIGRGQAQEIALSDSGIVSEKASDMSVDMIKISDHVCYKVQFKGAVTDYRYIIDAETGNIVTQTFYRPDSEG